MKLLMFLGVMAVLATTAIETTSPIVKNAFTKSSMISTEIKTGSGTPNHIRKPNDDETTTADQLNEEEMLNVTARIYKDNSTLENFERNRFLAAIIPVLVMMAAMFVFLICVVVYYYGCNLNSSKWEKDSLGEELIPMGFSLDEAEEGTSYEENIERETTV